MKLLLDEYEEAYHPTWEPGLITDPVPYDYQPDIIEEDDSCMDSELDFHLGQRF
jgi:hypothetical protein